MRVDVDSEIEPRGSVSDYDVPGKVQWSLPIHEVRFLGPTLNLEGLKVLCSVLFGLYIT